MGMRTIIAINHDYSHMIEREPEAFLDQIRMLLNSGSESRLIDGLHRFGIKVTPTHHNSMKAEVVLGGQSHEI